MLVFLDCEYTDPINIDLISIGMVTEDGRFEFYAERSDFPDADCNQFVRAAVLPLLYTVPTNVMTRAQLTERLHGWFATLSKEMVIACDDQTDWELLVDVFDGELPANIVRPHRNLRPLIDTIVYNRAACQYHSVPGQPWHHALHDAKAHRMGWLAWTDLAKEKTN